VRHSDADADARCIADAGRIADTGRITDAEPDANAGNVPDLHEPDTHPYPGWRAWYD